MKTKFFFVLLLCAPLGLCGQSSTPSAGLPAGFGWHRLPDTQMRKICLDNVPDGMYADATMTKTTEYTFNCNQIIPWSSGAGDDVHQRLIVWGGGHSDYAGNEVSVLNLSGTPAWERFTAPTMPVPYAWDGKEWEGLKPYFVRLHDGGKYEPGSSPSSRHTYNGLQYDPVHNRLYSFGGSVANGGFLSQEVWALDMTTRKWTMIGPPFSQSPAWATSAYDPNTHHIVMHDRNWTLWDYDPETNKWKKLSTAVHVDDGTTAAIDPVNNLLVIVGAGGTPGNTGYPSVPRVRTLQVFSLSGRWETWKDNGCDLIYRHSGLAWDSALGLMVGYPGGGDKIYLLNTNSKEVTTPFGTVPAHKCLDVAISKDPAAKKGVDYPPDPDGTGREGNLGIYGRFAYFPSLEVFVEVNSRDQDAWILRLTDKKAAP